jgi:anti-anti-sigma factor
MGDIRVNATGIGRTTITVHLDGDIDHASTDDLRETLVDVIVRRKPDHLIIDLDGVTKLDAAAVGMLQAAQTTALDAGLTAIFRTSRSPLTDQLDSDGISHGPAKASSLERC